MLKPSQIRIQLSTSLKRPKFLQDLREGRAKDGTISILDAAVKKHGLFNRGKDAMDSVYHVVVMDAMVEMELKTKFYNPRTSMVAYVLDKHGPNSYYGQEKE